MVDSARSFIYIAVMNYLPTMEFSHPRRYCWVCAQGLGRGALRVEEEWERKGRGSESSQWSQSKGTMEGKQWGEAEKTGNRERGSQCSSQGKKGQKKMRILVLGG